MSEVLLLALSLYLWLIGGWLLAFGAAGETFHGVPRYKIAIVVLCWPMIVLGGTAVILWEAMRRALKAKHE